MRLFATFRTLWWEQNPLEDSTKNLGRPKNSRIFCAALGETSLGVTLVSAQYHQNVAVSSCFYIKSAAFLAWVLGSMASFCSINLALVSSHWTKNEMVFLPAKKKEWRVTSNSDVTKWTHNYFSARRWCFILKAAEQPHQLYRVKYSSRKISFRSFSLVVLLFESIFLRCFPPKN